MTDDATRGFAIPTPGHFDHLPPRPVRLVGCPRLRRVNDVPAELLRDFASWAEVKARDVDLMLSTSCSGCGRRTTSWSRRTGRREASSTCSSNACPPRGPQKAFEPEVVTGTLDAFFRFLRNTGRMPHDLTDVLGALGLMADSGLHVESSEGII